MENKWLEVVLKAISERKAENIVVYETQDVTPFMEYLIVASTNNIRMNNAIAQNIKDRLKEAGYEGDMKVEGKADSKWLLIDLKEIVVNLFVAGERSVYGLDNLYSDCRHYDYDL